MIQSQPATLMLTLAEATDINRVGGKAANLGHLIRAGFRVPPGFVIDTQVFRDAADASNGKFRAVFGIPEMLADKILAAYHALGSGPVAVRSSATAEDLADASMAGQYDTFLDVEGDNALLEAVHKCWASFDTPRIHAYFREHAIDPADVAMAVVVQRLVPAEIAGVLFTINPQPGRSTEMLIEASAGLGEAVVSGRVQPDVVRVKRDTGDVLSMSHTGQACLSEAQIRALWQLGRRVAEHFDTPQDIEWAIYDGEVFLLQSRPITTIGDAQVYEALLHSTQQHLRDELSPARGPWVLHNLAEILPHPVPLSWSIVRRYMSGDGAMGKAYRRVGFEPSATVCDTGFLELIVGRVYMDVSRSPEMFFQGFPFVYDLNDLKSRPDAGQAPPTVPRGTFFERMRTAKRLDVVNQRMRDLVSSTANQLTGTHFPALEEYVKAARRIDLTSLSNDQLIEAWRERCQIVLDAFATESIVASLLTGYALGELRAFVQDCFWKHHAQTVAEQLAAGGEATRTLLADAELRQVGHGELPLADWLESHGHRGTNEFDLAAPRWREQPENVQKLANSLARGECPLARRATTVEASNRLAESLKAELSTSRQAQLDELIKDARRYMALREDAKDCLMLGYELLRNLAIAVGERLNIGDDVFFLNDTELRAALASRHVPQARIEERKRTRRTEKQVSLPTFIDASAIATLGNPQELKLPAGGLAALPLSSGVARGPARILHSPIEAAGFAPGYILVCPSTDPSWTTLFASAAGIVLECGGSLSHGAIVAREMGVPAVVLPGATQMFADGELIQLDGNRGWVARVNESAKPLQVDTCDSNDTRIPAGLIPPPPGQKDRGAAKLRNICAAVWAFFLAGFFLLPENIVRLPTVTAIDWFLWPLVRSVGKPGTVGIVAAGLAIIALLLQKLVTDNSRLREAKRRAGILQREAKSLPLGSPRRRTISRLTSAAQMQSLLASLAPIGILLGPMALPFVWFSDRIDPAVASASAGAAVQVIALVRSDWQHPVSLEVPETVALDETTPALRTLPPLRHTLDRLLVLLNQPANDTNEPWELQGITGPLRQRAATDLKNYLATGIPPQGVTWTVRPPSDFVGKFEVTLKSADVHTIAAQVCLGDYYPPQPAVITGPDDSPLVQVSIVYPKPKVAQGFWQPFSKLADHSVATSTSASSIANRLAAIDISWLWLYLIVYLPVIIVARKVFSVA